jgi:predicted lipid-binding transport protein (Tim44 family)
MKLRHSTSTRSLFAACKRFLAGLCVLAALLSITGVGLARPGGGSSYKGGSSRSGGSYSGGSKSSGNSGSSRSSGNSGSSRSGSPIVVPYGSDGESRSSRSSESDGGAGAVIFLLFVLFVLIAIVVLVVVFAKLFAKPKPAEAWSTDVPLSVGPRAELEKLREVDPGFSLVVFEDFLNALYTDVLRAQAAGELAKMSAYVSPQAMQSIGQRDLRGISVVLMGGTTIDVVEGIPYGPNVSVTLVIEANLGRREASGQEHALYVMERWTLTRSIRARSRTPDKARTLACPNCGAPLHQIFGGRCNHCSQNVSSGAFDWVVTEAQVTSTEAVGPMLTGTTEEQGTDLPTILDPSVHGGVAMLTASDPAFQWENFTGRVNLVFSEFQTAWASRDLAKMRPFMSDTLFGMQTYWVSEYLRQKLRNVTENATLEHVELARVTQDAYFDAIIVRVYASSADYTITDDGQVVGGSRTARRRYSEYWTLIRGKGAKGPAKTTSQCPRCGAPLNVTMAGDCTYCQARVTSGQFDWVLSRIEQDDAYVG